MKELLIAFLLSAVVGTLLYVQIANPNDNIYSDKMPRLPCTEEMKVNCKVPVTVAIRSCSIMKSPSFLCVLSNLPKNSGCLPCMCKYVESIRINGC